VKLILIFVFIGLVVGKKSFSQDSLYAKRIDSTWLHSYDHRTLYKKRLVMGNVKVVCNFYKASGNVRSIVAINKTAKENLLFFYQGDKLVMISPSGQEPYFILNDILVFAKQLKHTTGQIQEMIHRAYQYLEQAYISFGD
jgi:hypothetical protein